MGGVERRETGHRGVERREVLRWGAWSAPVLVAAVAAPAAAASTGFDLGLAFTTPATTQVNTGGAGSLTVDYVEVLRVTNTGPGASAAGAEVLLVFDQTIVALAPTGPGVTTTGAQGTLVLTLPALVAGSSVDVALTPTWIPAGFAGIGAGQSIRTWSAVIVTGPDLSRANDRADATVTITAGPPV